MKLPVLFALGSLFLLPVVGNTTQRQHRGRTSAPVLPDFVKVLHIRLGVDTERRLERRIGKGEVTLGGHSNSGREWWYSNGLALYADAFQRTGNQRVLDTLHFSEWRGRLGDTKELKDFGLGVWSKVCIGMTRQECLQALPAQMPKPIASADAIVRQQNVNGTRAGKLGTFDYEATLQFSSGRLKSLLLEGSLIEE